MRRLILLPVLLATASGYARVARVETRTGGVIEGHVRFESNCVVVANAGRGLLVRLPATNLLLVRFPDDPSSAQNPGVLAQSGSTALPFPWRSEDVGRASAAGGVTLASSLTWVKAAGTQIAEDSDSFHYVCKPVRGRAEILARVLHLQPTHRAAQAGLMLRENLDAKSRHVFIGLTPARGGTFRWRGGDGAHTIEEPLADLRVPCWLRLKREGDEFTACRSRDGRQWNLVGRATCPMAEECFIGLAVAAGPDGQLTQAIFDQVRDGPVLWSGPFVPRVELRSGSVVVGLIRTADDTAVHFWGAPPRLPVSTFAVSRIFFQWLTPRMAARIRSGEPGILLRTGEFIEGRFRGIDHGQARISSVVLGVRRFDVEAEVAAVLLRKPAPGESDYVVRARDGSTWRGRVKELGQDEVLFQEPALGLCRVPLHELAEVRWTDEPARSQRQEAATTTTAGR